jgi:hypothetical protein
VGEEADVKIEATGIPVRGPLRIDVTVSDADGVSCSSTYFIANTVSVSRDGDSSPPEDEVAYGGAKTVKLAYRNLVRKLMGDVELNGELGRVWRATLAGGKATFTVRRELL